MGNPIPSRDALKPCPFCGGEASVSSYDTESLWSHDTVTYTKVGCDDCDIHFNTEPGFEVEAPAKWNTRATPPSPAGLEGYKDAFYQIAELLDIPAQALSPREVFDTQIMPRLRAALTANGSQPDRVVDVLERIANDIVRDVCELPGDDDIEADDTLIVSVDDLRGIVERNLATLDAKDQI